MSPGTVAIVGAGPGDAGLITVRALERLRAADVVLYDRLVDPRLLDEAPAHAERIFVGKRVGDHVLQPRINELLVLHARRGRRVVRLKGGDPFVFGRGSEEADVLAAAGIPFEIVPGVTSAVAVPAYAGIPATHRGVASSFAVVTAHEDPDKGGSTVDWSAVATAVDTLVILMGASRLAGIVDRLVVAGRRPDTPIALIRWGTTDEQVVVTATLADIVDRAAAAALRPPVVAVVGDVVRLRERLRWFGEDGHDRDAPVGTADDAEPVEQLSRPRGAARRPQTAATPSLV
ncbi:MAG: uroporphyrinogen-III C-methyltransferase [Candidatus Rokubacteria bacterium]|nr:uroporphyrinogen-III C-methyltransferase [Candidatus Rokubacteria bacterium]